MVNPINFNPSVMPSLPINAKEEVKEQKTPSSTEQKPSTNYQSAEDVLNFMSQNSNVDIANRKSGAEASTTSRTIEVAKYVTPEQAKRIGGFVSEFETAVADGLKQFEQEFSYMPEFQGLSNGAKQEMAVQLFNTLNMPDAVEA